MISIPGYYFSGQTSKHQNACLEVIDDLNTYLIITDESGQRLNRIKLNAKRIKISSRLANTPRRIELGETELFTTQDHEAVEELIKTLKGKHSTKLHTLESNSIVILFALMLTIATIFLTLKYGIPRASEAIVHSFPELATKRFEGGLDLLDKTWFKPSTLAQEKQAEIISRFEPFIHQYPSLKANIHFRSGIGPNALALPSGDIVFTDELIALAENDLELIAILFHELGHLEHKHMARRAVQSLLLTIISLLMIGDISQVDLLAGLPALLLDLSYSREFEREADLFSLHALQDAEISKVHFANIMKKLNAYSLEELTTENEQDQEKTGDAKKETQLLRYLSTHPGTDERIEMINQFPLISEPTPN